MQDGSVSSQKANDKNWKSYQEAVLMDEEIIGVYGYIGDVRIKELGFILLKTRATE